MKEFEIDGKKHYYRLTVGMEDAMSKSDNLVGITEFAKQCLVKGAEKKNLRPKYDNDTVEDLLEESMAEARAEQKRLQKENPDKKPQELTALFDEEKYLATLVQQDYNRIYEANELKGLVKKSKQDMVSEMLSGAMKASRRVG